MKIKILIFTFFLNISNIYAQIYSVGNGDGFSVNNYVHNSHLGIYSVGKGDGFSVNSYIHNSYLAIYSVGSGNGFSFNCSAEISLPIEYLSFIAYCSTQKIILSWITASEINNNFFTIERSTDNVNFLIIGTVIGSGNSSQSVYYTFEDIEPLDEISYYRLKQTDFDGQFKYSKIVSIKNCKETTIELIVYPNPSNGIFSLLYTGDKEEVSLIKVYNAMGEIVYHSFNYRSILDITNKERGIYFVQVISRKGILTRKIIYN